MIMYNNSEVFYVNLINIELSVPTSYTKKYLKSFEKFYKLPDFSFTLRCEKISRVYCENIAVEYSNVKIDDSETDEFPYDFFCRNWENVFSKCRSDAVQRAFVCDTIWKIKTDKVFPYHLNGEEWEKGLERISALIKNVDDKLLFDLNSANGYYLLKLKHGANAENILKEAFEKEAVDLTFTKLKSKNDKIEVCGYLQSPIFDYCEKPSLYVEINGETTEAVSLALSSYCYDDSKIRNNTAWAFRVLIEGKDDVTFSFKIETETSEDCRINYKFGEWVAFNSSLGRYEYVLGGKRYKFNSGKISVTSASATEEKAYKIKAALSYVKTNKKVFAVRMMNVLSPKKRIWLYHDCKGVGKDNAYYQFIHDFEIKDGVVRYYVVNGNIADAGKYFSDEQKKYILTFRSQKHKLMYLKAEKIVTAFIEKVNYLPFFDDAYPHYIDLFGGEVVYLQHGILHAHLPWKYSYDRLDLSREVVSSAYEVENFTKNYGFPEEALIKSKMPRYDFIDCENETAENKIIFAPSWRKYLVSLGSDGDWITDREKFVVSDYFKETSEFLQSEKLSDLLEKNNWYLDYKPHPIFARYNDCYEIKNPRISIPDTVNTADYKICVTDYSSYVFDFVYLGRAVVYFMPDYAEFKSGLNDYRELDIPLENGFGELTETADEAVNAIGRIIENGGRSLDKFAKKNNGFFFNKEKNCRDEIYDAIK